jgi:hypothetical protein
MGINGDTGYRFHTLFLTLNREDKILRKPSRPQKATANTIQATNDNWRINDIK